MQVEAIDSVPGLVVGKIYNVTETIDKVFFIAELNGCYNIKHFKGVTNGRNPIEPDDKEIRQEKDSGKNVTSSDNSNCVIGSDIQVCKRCGD